MSALRTSIARRAIDLVLRFPPISWLLALDRRHSRAICDEIFEGEPYSVRYVLFGATADDSESIRQLGSAHTSPISAQPRQAQSDRS